MVGPALVRRAARRGAAWLPAGVRVRALRRIGPALGRRLGVGGAEIGLVSLVVVVEPADESASPTVSTRCGRSGTPCWTC